MKINEFKLPEEELYNDEDINAVIQQAVNGEWESYSLNQFLEHLKNITGGTYESAP